MKEKTEALKFMSGIIGIFVFLVLFGLVYANFFL